MAQKKSKLAKVFIFLTLIFIVFASFAVYIVMYAWFKWWNDTKCKSWYIRDEEIQDCVIETIEENHETPEINDEKTCKIAWWTWYKENWICILWDENNVTEDSQEQIGKVTEENPEDIATTEIPEENAESIDE